MQSGAYAAYERDSRSDDEDLFEAEEGENMVGFDVGRRERLPVRGSGGGVEGEVEIDSQRRLSRDLERGFRDDSDESVGDDRRR
jgi:hypothetical protein